MGPDILVLSDRGVDENHVPMPSLLAVAAVHQHLVVTKKQTSMSLILESGEPKRGSSFCHTFRLRSNGCESLSGPGIYPGAD